MTVHGAIITTNLTKPELRSVLQCNCCTDQHFTKEDLHDAKTLAEKLAELHEDTGDDLNQFMVQNDWFNQLCNLIMLLKSCYQEGLPIVRGDTVSCLDSILLTKQQIAILDDPMLKKFIKGK